MYVVEILVNANAKEYLPMFGRRKITKEQMNAMTNDELKLVSPFHLHAHSLGSLLSIDSFIDN